MHLIIACWSVVGCRRIKSLHQTIPYSENNLFRSITSKDQAKNITYVINIINFLFCIFVEMLGNLEATTDIFIILC